LFGNVAQRANTVTIESQGTLYFVLIKPQAKDLLQGSLFLWYSLQPVAWDLHRNCLFHENYSLLGHTLFGAVMPISLNVLA